MDDYRLRITSFEAGINIYTGRVQGGHAYAQIELPDRTRVDIERPLTKDVVQEFNDLEFGSEYAYDWGKGAEEGDTTMRLKDADQARELAIEWMKANAPDTRLVSNMYHLTGGDSGEVFYAPEA